MLNGLGSALQCIADVIQVPSDFPTIQEAIDVAVDGDEVIISVGTYVGVGNKDLDFGGRMITVRGESDDPALCVIDCEDAGRGFNFHSGEGETSVVQGLSIVNGNADDGGGVLCNGSSPTFINCVFKNNTAAASAGGGMYNTNMSSPTIIGCMFESNSAIAWGGGMMNLQESNPTLTNCTFENNTTEIDADGGGGGMGNHRSNPTLIECTFEGNSTNYYGGGMYCYESSPILTRCVFEHNSARYGGGICNEINSNPTITGCVFTNNFADSSGGGVYAFQTNPVLSASTICGNTPDQIFKSWTDQGGNCVIDFCDDCTNTLLTVSPDPLIAGQNGTFTMTDGMPNAKSYLVYSITGMGSTRIPQLNITLNLDHPKQVITHKMTDANGFVTHDLYVSTTGAGYDIWFQALQFEVKSNIIATSIVE